MAEVTLYPVEYIIGGKDHPLPGDIDCYLVRCMTREVNQLENMLANVESQPLGKSDGGWAIMEPAHERNTIRRYLLEALFQLFY
jgi:hypothetical protein